MINTVKVYYQPCEKKSEIRMFSWHTNFTYNFQNLKSKIVTLFDNNLGENFAVQWKDLENDLITVSSVDELSLAVHNNKGEILKLYISRPDETLYGPKTSEEAHPGVECDGCNKYLVGDRYKCLMCNNYDLCARCNFAGVHPDHDMIKLVKSVEGPHHMWMYGGRKMWNNMFGHYKPHHRRCSGGEPSGEAPKDKKHHGGHPHKCPINFDKILGDVYQEADQVPKLVGDVIGNLLQEFNKFVSPTEPTADPNTPKASPQDAAKPAEKESSVATDAPAETKPGAPSAEAAINQPESPTSVLLAEAAINEPSTSAPSAEAAINEPKASTRSDEAGAVGFELNRPAGLFSKEGSDPYLCDWTVIPNVAPSGGEEEKVAASVAEPVVQYPKLHEHVAERQTYPKVADRNPKVAAALDTMCTMGFTNEGGWLERLLLSKNGNIEEALEALYPRANRRG